MKKISIISFILLGLFFSCEDVATTEENLEFTEENLVKLAEFFEKDDEVLSQDIASSLGDTLKNSTGLTKELTSRQTWIDSIGEWYRFFSYSDSIHTVLFHGNKKIKKDFFLSISRKTHVRFNNESGLAIQFPRLQEASINKIIIKREVSNETQGEVTVYKINEDGNSVEETRESQRVRHAEKSGIVTLIRTDDDAVWNVNATGEKTVEFSISKKDATLNLEKDVTIDVINLKVRKGHKRFLDKSHRAYFISGKINRTIEINEHIYLIEIEFYDLDDETNKEKVRFVRKIYKDGALVKETIVYQ